MMRKYVAVATFFLLSVLLLQFSSFYLTYIELKAYDFMMAALRGPLEPREDIMLVAVDQPSIDEFQTIPQIGPFPWPRWVHGALVDQLNLAGVKAIVFDVVFDQQLDPESDADFARAIRDSQVPVILAATVDEIDDPNFGRLSTTLYPIDPLLEAGAIVGFARLYPGADDRIRHGLLTHNQEPSLALAAFEAVTGEELDTEGIPVAQYRGEKDDAEILINYVGDSRSIYTVSYYQAIDWQTMLPADALKGKIVFIGYSMAIQDISEGMEKDMFAVPFTDDAFMPGAEIHANALSTLLSRNFISQMDLDYVFYLTLVLGLLISGIVLGFEAFRPKILLSVMVIASFMVVAALLFVIHSYWLMVVQPVVFMTSVFAMNTLYQYWITEKERAHVRKALKGYISGEVMNEILKDPRALELGGEQVEATVLFSDIAGFSKISEATPPRELFSMLNNYFTEIGDAIMEREGMINKYIGDAVMAIWNAPKPNPRHAVLAVSAALEMKRIVEKMDPLKMRIGVNTGPMVAGNLGHSERMEYTVIGDAVNLASRLEGANKPFGTSIMISDTTEELVRGEFLLRLLDCIRVIGKQQPIKVYEVLAGIDEPMDGLHEMVQSFERLIEAYEARDWDTAIAACQKHLEQFPDDKVGHIYLERCREFKVSPPASDWDGVYALKSK